MAPLATVKSYVRFLLLMMLGASFLTFVGSVLVQADMNRSDLEAARSTNAAVMAKQADLEGRLGKLEEERASDTDKLRALSERQADFDRDPASLAVRAPFKISEVVGAIVELICIDNGDKDVYYTGSGVLVESSGLIVTNRHTLESQDGSQISYCGVGFTSDLKRPPRIEYAAKSAAIHRTSDLALLVISERLDGRAVPASFPHLSVSGTAALASKLNLGDAVYIAGYPGVGAETFTFTQGVVSGRVGADLIKTTALIDSGTSGGAAFDGLGRYIGVPTAAAAGEIGGSLGYLIGADIVEPFVKEYLKTP